jgi:hypothetical protein
MAYGHAHRLASYPGNGLRRRSRHHPHQRHGVPEGYDVDLQRVLIASRDPRGLSLDMLSLATFLYENEEKTGPRLAIAAEFTSDE